MNGKTICIFKNLFDIECAGCGGTRMFMALLRLDFYQAFRYNPYIFIVLCLALIYIIYMCVCKFLNKKIYVPNIKILYVFIGTTFLFMVLRNLEAFEFLLPTDV